MDVVKVILQASEYLINEQFIVNQNITKIDESCPFLYIDRMSRLFIPEKPETEIQLSKIYSIVFPFSYNIEQHGLFLNQIPANNLLNSCLKSIISMFEDCLPDTMEKILDCCWEVCKENDLSSPQCDELITLFTELLVFDIGYIRYDYDEEHQNGVIHPLHHLDINYSNQSTYKIGLKQSLNGTSMKNILDTNEACWFLCNK